MKIARTRAAAIRSAAAVLAFAALAGGCAQAQEVHRAKAGADVATGTLLHTAADDDRDNRDDRDDRHDRDNDRELKTTAARVGHRDLQLLSAAGRQVQRLSPVGEPGKTWSSMQEYMDFALGQVHAYWSEVEAGFGRPQPTVTYLWPDPGAYYTSACGTTNDRTMHYCGPEDMIVFSQAAAQALWNGTFVAADGKHNGRLVAEFGVAYLIAHEYAHNMQREYGLPELYSTLALERHADCWAGAWASSAYYAGTLEGTDVDEAISTAVVISDTREDHVRTHGSPQERPHDFLLGYNGVDPRTCDALLG